MAIVLFVVFIMIKYQLSIVNSQWSILCCHVGCGAVNIGTPFLDDLSHVVGQGRGKVHLLTRSGMAEAQCLSMQYLSGAEVETVLDECLVGAAALTAQNFGATIALVAEQRMADVSHVGTDLMSAARL